MIVTSTFVVQVMKFEDLKELGSESAVKVYAPLPPPGHCILVKRLF